MQLKKSIIFVAMFVLLSIGMSDNVYGRLDEHAFDPEHEDICKIYNEPVYVVPLEKVLDLESCGLTQEEVDLVALVCLGEAEGESELGKRLVIDTIINRLYSSRWPDTVSEVCWQRGQYGCLHNGRCRRVSPNDYIRQLIFEELAERTNEEVIYFSGGGYNGSPLFVEGGHYFSK